uniref:Uncharacterized protein n=1 Tax=Globodera rostochiensis TaxID=31243 RepID=A0A914I6N0_GLORO
MSTLDDTIYAEFNASNHFNDIYTRTTHRVRRALFPEIQIDEDASIDEELNGENTGSVVSHFARPSQLLKDSILDLLSVRSPPAEAAGNIPQLIRQLNANDQNEMLQAASLVHLLSKEDKVVVSLASSEPLMLALIKALDAPDEVTKRHAAAALCHLSAHQTGAHHIFRSGGIAELVRMLRCPILSIIHYAVTTLHHLLVYVEMAKEEAIVCGALEALVPLLAPQTAIPQSGPNPKLQAMVADSLYFLLLDNLQCKLTFLSLQGPRYLVEILKSNSVYVKLFYAVVRCIRSISTCSENKASLIAIGGLELLHRTFNFIDDDKRKLATLSAIRNLSDVATNLETLTPLVAELVALIGDHNDEELVSCACGILSNLTCNNILNKNTVCTSSGIPILARALSKFSNIEDVTEPALCTLRHCTVRHPLAFQAQNELRFAYPIILSLLSTQRPPIVKAALGLVRNCSLSNENLKRMLSEKTPDGDTLVQDWGGLCDGVSLLEMVEGAISALHQLAKDGASASQISNRSTIMKLLVYLMSNEKVNKNEDELMMREIMGLVYQLTKSREGAKAVLTYEAQPYISAALSSQHKSIAAYASIILKNMGVEQLRVQNFNNTFAGQIAPGVYGVSNGFDSQPMSAENTLERTNGAHRHHQMGWQNDGMEPELYNELYNYPPSLGELRQDHIEGSANNGMRNKRRNLHASEASNEGDHKKQKLERTSKLVDRPEFPPFRPEERFIGEHCNVHLRPAFTVKGISYNCAVGRLCVIRQNDAVGSKNGNTQNPLTIVEFYNAMKPPLIFLEKSIPVNDTFEVLIWMGNWAVLGGSGGRTTSLSPFTSKFGRVQVCVSDILVMVRTGEKQFVIGNSSSELLVLNSRDTVDAEESISKVPTFSTVQSIKLSSDEHISAIGCSKTMKPQMMAVGKVNGLTLFWHEKTQRDVRCAPSRRTDDPDLKDNDQGETLDVHKMGGDMRWMKCVLIEWERCTRANMHLQCAEWDAFENTQNTSGAYFGYGH